MSVISSTRSVSSSTRRSRRAAAVFATVLLGVTACVAPLPPVPDSPIEFTEHSVAEGLPGAAFVVAADVHGDSSPELVASSFGGGLTSSGRVTLHTRGATLADWTTTEIAPKSDRIRFPNDPTVTDVDGDGDADVIVPGGFFLCELTLSPCGSLQWYEQDGTDWHRHQVVPAGNSRFYHAARITDVDGDGLADIVTVSETGNSARTEWFRGTTGPDRFENSPRVIGEGGGSLPVVEDVDGDGDEDVVSPQYFGGSGFVWFERTADPTAAEPAGTWIRHTITEATGKGFAVERVEDLLGDGTDRWVTTNHVANDSAGVYLLDQPADPTLTWNHQLVSQGIRVEIPEPGSAAPGVLGHGDIDGDGDTDIAVSGDGDPRVFWLRQEADDSFSTFVIDESMGQAGGAIVTDLDGNGTNEIVFSSYDKKRISVYERP